MQEIIGGAKKAIELLLSFNEDVYGVVGLSVFISYTATIISIIFFVPVGVYLGLLNKLHWVFEKSIYTLMSIPTVIVGLCIALLFSRKGPLGEFDLLFTPEIMIIGQAVLVAPLIVSSALNLSKTKGRIIKQIGESLGANRFQVFKLIIFELKVDIILIFITAFSRAIAEVGVVMIVGGNIQSHTRVMTTSIAMYNSMGDYPKAIAFGIVLLSIAFANNICTIILDNIQFKKQKIIGGN